MWHITNQGGVFVILSNNHSLVEVDKGDATHPFMGTRWEGTTKIIIILIDPEVHGMRQGATHIVADALDTCQGLRQDSLPKVGWAVVPVDLQEVLGEMLPC